MDARDALSLPALTVALVLLAWPGPATAAFPGENGRIAYGYDSANRLAQTYEEQGLYAVQPNGKGAQALKRCARWEGKPPEGDCSTAYASPAYSPDGARLAFDAGGALALTNSDGSGLRVLAQASSDDGQPAWSPTGRRLVFTGTSGPDQFDLWTLKVQGGEPQRLTDEGGQEPAWSSRNRIAFTRGGDVYTMRPDGSGLRRVTHAGGSSPTWSPSGTRLAFVREGHIFIIGANGRRLRKLRLPWDMGVTGGLAWSPDGKRLAFDATDCLGGGIFTTRVDGRARRNILLAGSWCRDFGHIFPSDPDWQPLR